MQVSMFGCFFCNSFGLHTGEKKARNKKISNKMANNARKMVEES